MIRALLDLPNSPAIITIEYVLPSVHHGHRVELTRQDVRIDVPDHGDGRRHGQSCGLTWVCIAKLTSQHKGLNEYYDIPGISVRNPFMQETFANISMVAKYFKVENEREEKTLEDIDTRHVSCKHHGAGLTRPIDLFW
jgi:hypothetical protein